MALEQTLSIIKPDAISKGFAEEICERLEDEPTPVCVAAERHFTGIGVSYKFDRTWLTDWQQIRRNVIAFVEARLLP